MVCPIISLHDNISSSRDGLSPFFATIIVEYKMKPELGEINTKTAGSELHFEVFRLLGEVEQEVRLHGALNLQ